MTQKILVPLDSSSVAGPVLAAAIAQARWRGADLVLLRAISLPTELPIAASLGPPDKVPELLEISARNELTKQREQVPADVEVTMRVEFGAAWQVITEVAKSEDVALIVMGAHDRRLFDGLLGTNTSRVVNHSDRSVLIVRGG